MHIYRVAMQRGEYWHIVVDQRGIDLVVTLHDPHGVQIRWADSSNGAFGPEPISVIAESTGEYRVKVSSLEPKAPKGRYEILATRHTAPNAEDKQRIAAETALFEGLLLRNTDTLAARELALRKFEEALSGWQALGDLYQQAWTLTTMGRFCDRLGQKRKALQYYQQSIPIHRLAGDQHGEAQALNNIAIVYDDLGEKQKALEDYGKALEIERAVHDRMLEASTLANIGLVYSSLALPQKALEYLLQSLPISREMGDREAESYTLKNLGALYFNLHDTATALRYYRDAVPVAKATHDGAVEALVQRGIGLAYYSLGKKQLALQYLGRALSIQRTVGDRNREALTLKYLGNVYNDLGEHQKALDCYYNALQLATSVGNIDYSAQVLNDLMLYWKARNEPRLAVIFGKKAVNQYQQLRTKLKGLDREIQQSFAQSKEATYRELADLLVSQGRLFEAQQVLDLLKEEEFKEFTRGDKSGGAEGAVAMTPAETTVEERYNQVAGTVTTLWAEWDALNKKKQRTPEDGPRLKELTKQLDKARESFLAFVDQELYEQLGGRNNAKADSDVRELKQKESLLQRVLRQVEPGTAALYTVAAPERLIIILVLPNASIPHEYPIKADALRVKVNTLWGALRNNSPNALPAAQELYKIILGPVEKDLETAHAKTLMWSLDGVLRYIPIAALHDGHQYVVEKYRNEVFTLSSIDMLKDVPRVDSWQVLAAGVSKSYGDSQELPTVPSELQSIVRAKAGSQVGLLEGQELLDEDFTEDTFTDALATKKFPLVHIASHFHFQNVYDLSYLLMGGKNKEGEHVTLAHIESSSAFDFVGTELLTLSACETALSGERNGREIDGLGEIVQRRGAKAVIASLWSVNDRSTGALMRKFYETWTANPGMPKAEALRQAQVALLHGDVKPEAAPAGAAAVSDSFAHPYYWAPFILIGNWR